VSKTYAPGTTLALNVRPISAFSDPVFYVDEGDGRAKKHDAVQRDDGTLMLVHKLPTKPGRYFVELEAKEPPARVADPSNPWRRSVLLFPIYVGVRESSKPDAYITTPPANPREASAWSNAVLDAYNAERARFGLSPLLMDPRLRAKAQQRAELAISASTDLPFDEQLSSQIGAAVWQSQGDLEFISEHVAMQLLRPSVRARLLASDISAVGVGIAPRLQATKQRQHYALVEYWLTH